MEGYKTFTEALQKAHEFTDAWTSSTSGDYMSFEDMVDLSLTEDMLFGLDQDEYYLALDDGAICVCSFILKKITILFHPAKEKKEKTAGRRFCKKCGSPLNPDAQFCKKCGAKVA